MIGKKIATMKLRTLLIAVLWHCASAGLEHANKCCPDSNVLDHRRCRDNTTIGNKTRISLNCEHGMFIFDSTTDESESFEVDTNGMLTLVNSTEAAIEKDTYCIVNKEQINDSNNVVNVPIALVCFPDPDERESFATHSTMAMLMVASVSCLVLTLIVYIIVPQLRDLQGMCTMCLCGSLALGFLHLAIAQTATIDYQSNMCYLTAFGMYYWLMSAFFWMNVISINMMRSVLFRSSKTSPTKLFFIYNTYGWGVPAILLIATAFSQFLEGSHLKPGIGEFACWFNGKKETWAFFYGPIGVLLAVNIFLFALTSKALWYKTNYENVTKLRSMKYKFCLYIKLFLITGISWIFELLSFAADVKNVAWMIADVFNALQGVVYFLVLIAFRRRALKGLATIGLKIPCLPRPDSSDIDEECDEIMGEEEMPAMTIVSH